MNPMVDDPGRVVPQVRGRWLVVKGGGAAESATRDDDVAVAVGAKKMRERAGGSRKV